MIYLYFILSLIYWYHREILSKFWKTVNNYKIPFKTITNNSVENCFLSRLITQSSYDVYIVDFFPNWWKIIKYKIWIMSKITVNFI